MECPHEHTNTQKFVEDALMTLKTFEKMTDKMMDESCDDQLIDIVYMAAAEVMNVVCPYEVYKHFPELEDDEAFGCFIDQIISVVEGKKDEDGTQRANS